MALTAEQARNLNFVLSEANSVSLARARTDRGGHRTGRHLGTGHDFESGASGHDAADLVAGAAGPGGQRGRHLAYGVDTTVDPQEQTVIARDAEVNAGYLRWTVDPAATPPAGDLDPIAVAAALLNVGIIVREGIFTKSRW